MGCIGQLDGEALAEFFELERFIDFSGKTTCTQDDFQTTFDKKARVLAGGFWHRRQERIETCLGVARPH